MKTSDEKVQAAVADIAQQLQETNPIALDQIERIVRQLGLKKSYAFLRKTLEIEAMGGVMTHDGSRRRTPGGAFFFVVRGRITPQDHAAIWPKHKYPHARQQKQKQSDE